MGSNIYYIASDVYTCFQIPVQARVSSYIYFFLVLVGIIPLAQVEKIFERRNSIFGILESNKTQKLVLFYIYNNIIHILFYIQCMLKINNLSSIQIRVKDKSAHKKNLNFLIFDFKYINFLLIRGYMNSHRRSMHLGNNKNMKAN